MHLKQSAVTIPLAFMIHCNHCIGRARQELYRNFHVERIYYIFTHLKYLSPIPAIGNGYDIMVNALAEFDEKNVNPSLPLSNHVNMVIDTLRSIC